MAKKKKHRSPSNIRGAQKYFARKALWEATVRDELRRQAAEDEYLERKKRD